MRLFQKQLNSFKFVNVSESEYALYVKVVVYQQEMQPNITKYNNVSGRIKVDEIMYSIEFQQ